MNGSPYFATTKAVALKREIGRSGIVNWGTGKSSFPMITMDAIMMFSCNR